MKESERQREKTKRKTNVASAVLGYAAPLKQVPRQFTCRAAALLCHAPQLSLPTTHYPAWVGVATPWLHLLQQLHLQVTCNCFLRMRNFLINAACRSHKSWHLLLLQLLVTRCHLHLVEKLASTPHANCTANCR